MENNFKGTRGDWHFGNDNFSTTILTTEKNALGKESICFLNGKSDFADKENGKLIIDAGNIRQQINCDLPELLERYNKAVELLGYCYENTLSGVWSIYQDEGGNITENVTEKIEQFLKTIEK